MNLIMYVALFFQYILNFVNSLFFILILLTFIVSYHILLFLMRDMKYIKILESFEDRKEVKLEDLKEIPMVNIIVPAWKEREIFKGCLLNLTKLTYPKLKIIINAGGEDQTIEIANSFKKFKNFIINNQKSGGGKIKAINDCLPLVTEGLTCMMDADLYPKDEDLLNMLDAIINKNETIVASSLKPHRSQINKNLVRYLIINRNSKFKKKFTQHKNSISPFTILKLNAIKSIGKFSEKRLMGDGLSMGLDLVEKNFKIYHLKSQAVEGITYPETIKDYISQNIRWIQNFYFNKLRTQKKFLLTIILSLLKSIYIIIFPLFLLINLNLFLFGILFLIFFYLNRIRKIIFFTLTNDMNFYGKIKLRFYILVVFYIYLDLLINIYTFFEILFIGDKKFKKRKNIE